MSDGSGVGMLDAGSRLNPVGWGGLSVGGWICTGLGPRAELTNADTMGLPNCSWIQLSSEIGLSSSLKVVSGVSSSGEESSIANPSNSSTKS